jgi:hypothetical protein
MQPPMFYTLLQARTGVLRHYHIAESHWGLAGFGPRSPHSFSRQGYLKKKRGWQPLFFILCPVHIDYRSVRRMLLDKARGETVLYKLECTVKISRRRRNANPRYCCYESMTLTTWPTHQYIFTESFYSIYLLKTLSCSIGLSY